LINDSSLKKEKPTRIVAIDYGLARIGLAISDERKIFASPFMTVKAEKKAEKTAIKLLAELTKDQETRHYSLETILIGMPLLFSGKTGMLADEVTHFVELLKKLTSIPIVLWDERLTTVQAEKALREGNMNRKKRSKVIDTVSAAILLQSYLDKGS